MTKSAYTADELHDARIPEMASVAKSITSWKAKMQDAIAVGDDDALAHAAHYFVRQSRWLEYLKENEAFYQGESWTQIGKRHGITKQAAQQRFGKPYRDRN